VIVDPRERRWGRLTIRAVAVGLITPLAASALALLTADLGQGNAVGIYLLAITVAAVTGGLWAGVIAAVFATVAAPIIEPSSEPFHFDDATDLIAAVVFFAIAVVVGLVVGSGADERARATRREREARLLAYLSAKLLTGEVPDRVMDEFSAELIEPFGLASCQIAVILDGMEMHARADRVGETPGGPAEVVPIVVANIPLGTLIAERPVGRRPLTRDERLLLEAATRQMAVALDRARLDARARLAQLDAETNQLRAAMFSSVTHDLRTPLASIKAGVTSLLDADVQHDAEQERDLLTTILEETDRLNRLVGNILDLARVRAGALIPRRLPVAIDEIAEAVVGRLRQRRSDVTIDLQFPADLPEVPADPMQLDQVLTNLVENALRHSPAGGTVRIHLSRELGTVRARVADEGPGILPAEREKVFEPFYRGREAPESSGSGLGLAIARAIMTAHGGRIWVEETAAGGTAVVFQVPLEERVL
jgi:two-component system sensor histidine kinase KdpD